MTPLLTIKCKPNISAKTRILTSLTTNERHHIHSKDSKNRYSIVKHYNTGLFPL